MLGVLCSYSSTMFNLLSADALFVMPLPSVCEHSQGYSDIELISFAWIW